RVAAARGYAAASRAESTRSYYAADWRRFEAWCNGRGLCSLPALPTTVALYLSDMAQAGRRAGYIMRALTSISSAHKLAGHPSPRGSPAVAETVKGIRRTIGTAPTRKSPLLVDDLRSMVRVLPSRLPSMRDRALLCLGLAGGFRRSELVALEVRDLAFTGDGIEVLLR